MNDMTPQKSVKELLEMAEEYAEIALDNFTLEKRISEEDLEKIDDENIKMVASALADISQKHPMSYMRLGAFETLQLHFLFPNLTHDERELLIKVAFDAENVSLDRINNHPFEAHLNQWRKRQVSIIESGIEKKLTAIQIEILASEKFTPKGEK